MCNLSKHTHICNNLIDEPLSHIVSIHLALSGTRANCHDSITIKQSSHTQRRFTKSKYVKENTSSSTSSSPASLSSSSSPNSPLSSSSSSFSWTSSSPSVLTCAPLAGSGSRPTLTLRTKPCPHRPLKLAGPDQTDEVHRRKKQWNKTWKELNEMQ